MYIGRYQAEWESDREFCNLVTNKCGKFTFLMLFFLILWCESQNLMMRGFCSLTGMKTTLKTDVNIWSAILHHCRKHITENWSRTWQNEKRKQQTNNQNHISKTRQIFSILVLACYLWQFLIPGTFFETLCIINCNIMCTQSLVVKETKLGKGNDPDLCSKLFPQTCKLLPPM